MRSQGLGVNSPMTLKITVELASQFWLRKALEIQQYFLARPRWFRSTHDLCTFLNRVWCLWRPFSMKLFLVTHF
jgi:hypothetical protein